MTQDETKILREISQKLNVIIALTIKRLRNETSLDVRRKKGTGEAANYLADFGIPYQDIAAILSAPLPSVRELVSKKRRASKKGSEGQS